MRRFGSDKPDLRYGLELIDLTNAVRGTQFMVFKSATDSGGCVEGICVPGGAAFSRRKIDELTETVKTYGAQGPRVDRLPGGAGDRHGRAGALAGAEVPRAGA